MAEKVRINVSVDKVLLARAKKKLGFFGGKLSTLINAYLRDFVASSKEGNLGREHEDLLRRVKDLEEKVRRIES